MQPLPAPVDFGATPDDELRASTLIEMTDTLALELKALATETAERNDRLRDTADRVNRVAGFRLWAAVTAVVVVFALSGLFMHGAIR